MAGMVGPERPAGVYGALLRDLVRRGYTGALTLSDTLLVNMIRGTGHLRPSGTLIYVTLLDPAGDTLTRTVHYAALSPGLDPTTRLHNTPLQYRRAPYYLYVTVSACTV